MLKNARVSASRLRRPSFPVTVRPTKADVAARFIARSTAPAPEMGARALTWGAGEKVLLVLGFKLASFIGIACPGVIESDGSIAKGAQNLPGNWESSKFNLPATLVEAFPQIGEHDTTIVMHNDGVVQGLSEVPFMKDVKRWGVLTIGTGLGNARFTNRNGKGER